MDGRQLIAAALFVLCLFVIVLESTRAVGEAGLLSAAGEVGDVGQKVPNPDIPTRGQFDQRRYPASRSLA